jgi:hypothetical protein
MRSFSLIRLDLELIALLAVWAILLAVRTTVLAVSRTILLGSGGTFFVTLAPLN